MSVRGVVLVCVGRHPRAREHRMKPGPLIFAALLTLAVVYRRRQLSDLARGLAMIMILGLLVYGTGLVHPPSVETLIRDVTGTLGPYTYAVVGGLAFLETGAGVGLVAPGELAVIFGGVSAGHGEIELIPLIAIVWACALAGDLTSFVLGRRLGREFLVCHGPKVGITPHRLEQVERFFAAHGGKTIFIGRFVGLIRPLSPFIAGASKMPARRFIPLTTLAAGIWAATFSVLGYLFWQSLDQLIAITKQGTFALAAVIALVVAIIVLYRHLRGRSRRDASERLGPERPPLPPAWNDRQAQ
jgi:membrane protein DedA with SNARE-associated domain